MKNKKLKMSKDEALKNIDKLKDLFNLDFKK